MMTRAATERREHCYVCFPNDGKFHAGKCHHLKGQRFGLCVASWIPDDGTHHRCAGKVYLHDEPCECWCGATH